LRVSADGARVRDPHSLAADLTGSCESSVFGMAPQPLYDFLPCRWPDASRSTSYLPSPFVILLVLHDPKSITGMLAVPPASDDGTPFGEDHPKLFGPCAASLRTAASRSCLSRLVRPGALRPAAREHRRHKAPFSRVRQRL